MTITTELVVHTGIVGWLERRLAGWYLRRVYRAELAQLHAYVLSTP